MGSDLQPVTMLLDTGSPWVWISSKDCSNCRSGITDFNQATSTSYNYTGHSDMLSYGSGDIEGNIGTDALCVTKDDCAKDLRFMLGLEQTGLTFLRSSGVIGLSPGN